MSTAREKLFESPPPPNKKNSDGLVCQRNQVQTPKEPTKTNSVLTKKTVKTLLTVDQGKAKEFKIK